MRNTQNNNGISLLMAMGFSLAILAVGSLISATITQTQKNIRNVEDVTIAFFAAEAGIEEALYYESFHKRGFSDTNDASVGFQGFTRLGDTVIPNTGYEWEVDGRIDATECATDVYDDADTQCKGTIPFSTSASLYFSFDNGDKNTLNSQTDNDPNGTTITFDHDLSSANLTNTNGDYATLLWLASYLDSSGQETRLLPNHNGTSPYGTESNDCSNAAISNGNFICRTEVVDASNNPISFTANNATYGFEDDAIIGDFFDILDTDQRWRSLKFSYINMVPGLNSSDAPLSSIRYVVEPAVEMTATKTIVSSTGRSRNILSELEVEIDNSKEFTALDYGILFE